MTLLAGNTPVGHALIHSICNGGHRWKVRALVESPSDERDFTNVFAEEVASSAIETLIWQLLPDSELSQSFSTVSALFVLSESAAGAGGVKTAEFGTLAQTIRKMAAPLKRIVMLSSHGVERTDRLPYSMLNLWGGKLAKLRDAEQEMRLLAMTHVPAFSVIRVGKLLFDDAVPSDSRCELRPGDTLNGAVPIAAAGLVLSQSLSRSEAVHASSRRSPWERGEPTAASAPLSLPPITGMTNSSGSRAQRFSGGRLPRRARTVSISGCASGPSSSRGPGTV